MAISNQSMQVARQGADGAVQSARFWIVAVSLFSLLLAVVFANSIVRPISDVSSQITAIAQSKNLSSRIHVADRAEIGCIGRERADLVVAGCAILESIIDL